jgi:hypothetical protein
LIRNLDVAPQVQPLVAGSPEEVWKHLQEQGCFTPECIPTTLGGTWSYDKFTAWLHHQQRKDSPRPGRRTIPSLDKMERIHYRQDMKRRIDILEKNKKDRPKVISTPEPQVVRATAMDTSSFTCWASGLVAC